MINKEEAPMQQVPRRVRHSILVRILVFTALALTSLGGARTARAATDWIVRSTGDGAANAANCPSPACRLRDAIVAAAPGDVVTFDVSGTITLVAGELLVDKDLVISGPGADQLTIDADGASRVFNIEGASQASISGLTITGGFHYFIGGGVHALDSNLTLDRVAIRGNAAGGSAGACNGGGGLSLANGNYHVTNSEISGNTVTASTCVTRGAGIFVGGATVSLKNTTVSGNHTAGDAAGMHGDGGGIWIGLGATVHMNNVTVAANQAGVAGGGIFIEDAVGDAALAVDISNSIVADNSAPTGTDCYATAPALTSLDHNLVESIAGCSITGATGNNITGTDPVLQALADNGGGTQTMALAFASPARNAGSDATCEALDQRGVVRPWGPHCDVGAFEYSMCFMNPGRAPVGSPRCGFPVPPTVLPPSP
jgi:hypothetical protein